MFPIRDTVPARHPPVMTVSLILLNAAVFLLEISLGPENLESFVYQFGIVPARVTEPGVSWVGFRYLPFLTHMFLHGGWFHLIVNMWTLWLFGDNVEDRMGCWRFLAFYLCCGLVAGFVQFFTNAHSTLPMVGASGAIAGVLGAYFVMFPKARIIVMFPILFFPIFFELPAVLYLGFWFISQLFGGTLMLLGPQEVGGIAFWAHAGGFVTGVLLHPVFQRPKRKYRPWYQDESVELYPYRQPLRRGA